MEALTMQPNCINICRSAACFLLFLALSLSPVFAADRETDMFSKGYEYLFSFKPDKAAETFRAFLREFPHSSARDAAQFWLGKALIALGSYAEAEQLFLDIKRRFPESPFLSFIDNELTDIAKARSSITGKDGRETAAAAENVQSDDEHKAAEKDRRIEQVIEERDRMRALLEEEKKAVREHQLRISDLETKESLLRKQYAEAEAKLQRIADMENSLRQIRDERGKLLSEAEKLLTEKNRTEIDSAQSREQPDNSDQKRHARDSLLLKISELEHQVWQKEAELSEVNKAQENLRREAEQEKKSTDALRAEITRLHQIELIFKELWQSYEEVISDADQNSAIRREKITEHEARQPEITNALPQLKEQSTAGEQSPLPLQEGRLSFQPDSAQNEVLLIRGKAYTLAQIIHAVSVSEHAMEKLGIREPIWRTGNPLDDFINEQLLSDEASRSGAMPDEKECQEAVNHYNLAADEADYLRKLMIIGSFIEKTYKDAAPELSIEILTVHYKNGTSSQKTVTAADLQKAARSGMSFEEIQKKYRDSVTFSRLRVDEFKSRYKDKRQIIGKLNFLSEETAVIWSEKGYMVIKPIAGHRQFDLFVGFPKEGEEEIRSFLSGYIAELRKSM
jgi:hypothetical protein